MRRRQQGRQRSRRDVAVRHDLRECDGHRARPGAGVRAAHPRQRPRWIGSRSTPGAVLPVRWRRTADTRSATVTGAVLIGPLRSRSVEGESLCEQSGIDRRQHAPGFRCLAYAMRDSSNCSATASRSPSRMVPNRSATHSTSPASIGSGLRRRAGLHDPFKRAERGRVDNHHATSSRKIGAAWRSLAIARSRARVTDLAQNATRRSRPFDRRHGAGAAHPLRDPRIGPVRLDQRFEQRDLILFEDALP